MSMRLALFMVLTTLVGCTTYKSSPPPEVAVRNVLPFAIESDLIQNSATSVRASVNEFYKQSNYAMQWSDTLGPKPNVDSLVSFLREVEFHGLVPDDYHVSKIEALRMSPVSHQQAAELDVLLSESFLLLWHDLKSGRLNPKTFSRIKLDSITDHEAVNALRTSLQQNNIQQTLRKREITAPRYLALKSALQKILDLNSQDTTIQKHRDQLIANLERVRWEPQEPTRYISVNVPSYTLRVFDEDSLVLQSKVIIGKSETQTPNIKSVIRSFIIYPYWHVPRSIVKEILPSIQADTMYLKKHNYEVLNSKGQVISASKVDWAKYTPEDFPYVLRQREGYENTMGVIKFVFPNNYGVYLHDTNARGLFRKSDRALSHGCVRVQKAVDLAHYLAKDDDTYVSPEDLDQYLQVQARMEVKVVKPIPVHLDYFTCEVQGDSVVFYNDIYKKDRAMVDSLNRVKIVMPAVGL